jgi:hypothetical protein
MSLLTIASACLASSLVAIPTTSGARAGDSSLEFQVIGMRHIGTWVGSGVYSTDFPGVAKKGEKFTTESTCIWTAGRSAILCQDVEGNERKEKSLQLIYWDPAMKKLRMTLVDSGGNFDQGIGIMQGNKLVWESVGNFADGRPVKFQWNTTFKDDGKTQVHAGSVTVNGKRSYFSYAVKRVRK